MPDQQNPDISIRLMEKRDNPEVTSLILTVMKEFGAVGCGYSSSDAEVHDMYAAYSAPRASFYVVEKAGKVLGCGGFGPLRNADADTCELRKMYLCAELRGTGTGARLLQTCLDDATGAGYKRCYLETMDSMRQARRLYGRFGFSYLSERMGDTGHSSCGTWMARDL